MTTDEPRKANKFQRLKWKLLSVGDNYVEKSARKGFRKLGRCIGIHPWKFLVTPVIIVALLSTGLFKMKMALDVFVLYTPSNARAITERRIVEEYFEDEGGTYALSMIITAKDGGNLLRPDYIQDILQLLDYIEFNFTAQFGNFRYTFNDIRVSHKMDNELLKKVLLLYNSVHSSNISKSIFHFGYPVLSTQSESFSIASSLANVVINRKDGQIESAKQVHAKFRSAYVNESNSDLIHIWESHFLNPDSVIKHPTLNFVAVSDRLISHEIQRNGEMIKRYTPVSVAVIVLFVMITSSSLNCVSSKPLEALCGVVAPLLSVGGALGIVLFAGYPFLGLLLVIPMLVMALGLDVTFIILRNWKSTNPEQPVDLRIAETMAESGPSIIITSLTNIISAGVGAITNTLGVQLFCMTTAVAVIILFVLQITFLPAAVVLGARRENAKMHALLLCVKADKCQLKQNIETSTNPVKSSIDDMHIENRDWWYKVSEKLAKFECSYYCRVIVTLLLLVYWGVAIWGCAKLTLGLTCEKFYLKGSILTEYYKLDNGGLHESITLYLFVLKAPNFSNPIERIRFENLVDTMEKLNASFGKDATMLWLRPYKDYYAFNHPEDENYTDFYQDLEEFVNNSGSQWKNYLTLTKLNNEVYITKFLFSLCYKPAKSWDERTRYTTMWRDIIDQYSDLNVSIWDDGSDNYITDQLLSIPQNTIQDIVITGVCMAIICILFIPNIFNTVCAMITIFSINVGVFGFLVHWGISLDIMSMTCLLIAIGFSVDFTSHISFHYYASEGETQCEKLTTALASIGYPMLQSGTSTVLSIACILFVPSYVVQIFFKTVFLVVILGLLHGLIILPTYLAWLPLNFWDFLYIHNKEQQSTIVSGTINNKLEGNKPDLVSDIISTNL